MQIRTCQRLEYWYAVQMGEPDNLGLHHHLFGSNLGGFRPVARVALILMCEQPRRVGFSGGSEAEWRRTTTLEEGVVDQAGVGAGCDGHPVVAGFSFGRCSATTGASSRAA